MIVRGADAGPLPVSAQTATGIRGAQGDSRDIFTLVSIILHLWQHIAFFFPFAIQFDECFHACIFKQTRKEERIINYSRYFRTKRERRF